MSISATIDMIRRALLDTHISTDHWFDAPQELRQYRPPSGGWTIDEILEHIGLTSHFLLIIIEKGTRKALKKAQTPNWETALEGYEFHDDRLDEIGLHQSFNWIRPEHMEPKGQLSPLEVREQLVQQRDQCLEYLNTMAAGEGVLYKTTMSVNDLGKIDVYQYIYFLAQHQKRHIAQMERNAQAYAGKQV